MVGKRAQKKRQPATNTREQEEQHQTHIHRLKDAADGAIKSTKDQYKYWLDQKEAEAVQFSKDFEAYHAQKKKDILEYEEELMGSYTLVTQLSRIIHDMETGNFPICYKSGVKCVQLPPGLKPRLPAEAKHQYPKLFAAMGETRRKAEKYERMMNLRHVGWGVAFVGEVLVSIS